MDGRTSIPTPVCSCRVAGAWASLSVCTARSIQISSATLDRCGIKSEIIIPDCPLGFTGATGARARYLSTPTVTSRPSTGGEIFSPCFFRINSFGSNRSGCEGPPAINRKMTRLARGAKCGSRTASGFDAATATLLSMCCRASPPNPQADACRNRRRFGVLYRAESMLCIVELNSNYIRTKNSFEARSA